LEHMSHLPPYLPSTSPPRTATVGHWAWRNSSPYFITAADPLLAVAVANCYTNLGKKLPS
jgi:hypothetical protein